MHAVRAFSSALPYFCSMAVTEYCPFPSLSQRNLHPAPQDTASSSMLARPDTRRGDRRPTNHNAFTYYLRRRGIGEGGKGWRGEGGLNGGLFVSLMSVPSSCLFDLLGRVGWLIHLFVVMVIFLVFFRCHCLLISLVWLVFRSC